MIIKADTLEQEKQRLLYDREIGTHCGACGQFTKVYKRQIYSTVARALILAYKLSATKDTFHIGEILQEGILAYGDLQKTRFWGLLELLPEIPTNGARTSGTWRVTQKGKDFIEGKIKIPRYIYLYDGKFLQFDSSKETDIFQALGKRFNYNELMGG